MTAERYKDIQNRVKRVQDTIAQAAIKAGRQPQDITLLGVTKTQPAEAVRAVLQAGVTHIGENRVQELLDKAPALADIPHQAHLIGNLQRNKAKYLPGHITMLQSLNSIKTAEALARVYGAANQKLDVLIEVNIGEEASKSGISANQVEELAAWVQACPSLTLRGLMAIPPFVEGEAVRGYFQQMYQLFIDIKAKKGDNVNVLSMGMSADYPYAILEGATMVRVGSELFGPRVY